MDQDFRTIQRIRRLMRAGRYDEARILLKETNHPQVPALEAQLYALQEADHPAEARPPIISRRTLTLGALAGAAIVALLLIAGLRDIPLLLICFGVAGIMGMIAPEFVHRRKGTITYFNEIRNRDRSERGPRW